MSNELNNQTETINRSITVFDSILNSVCEIIPKVQSVQTMAEEIEKDKNVIIVKVNEVSEFANGLSANTQEMTDTSQDVSNATVKIAEVAQILEETSNKLMKSICKFKL
jgi:methyl-accepting chemotaxis protein